jgi:hypothetical protein
MNEKIPQHVILDLLPLYLAKEVSEETRNLIKEYLEMDPQLAKLAEQASRATSLQEIPAPLKKETEMESLKKAKKQLVLRNIYMVLALLFTFDIGILLIFHITPIAAYMFAWMAGLFWYAYYRVNKKMSD